MAVAIATSCAATPVLASSLDECSQQPNAHHVEKMEPRDLGNGTVLDEVWFSYDGQGRSYFDLRHCPSKSRLWVTYRLEQAGDPSVNVDRGEVEQLILKAANSSEPVTLDEIGRDLAGLGASVRLDHEKSAACSCKELYPETAGANQ